MEKVGPIIDFHCHPTLRALNTRPHEQFPIWEKTYNPQDGSSIIRWARLHTQEISKESQTSFSDYAQSGTRVVVDALYPIEKKWSSFRKLPRYLVGQKKREELIHAVFGIEKNRFNQLVKWPSYFEELKEAYRFITDGQGESPDGKYQYKLVRNSEELEYILQHEPYTLAVLLSVEGAHAFDAGSPNTSFRSEKELQTILTENIAEFKTWPFSPIYIGLVHHYWNRLAGHARSLKPPLHLLFDQEEGLNLPIQKAGWTVIEELLSTKNGKRILLDVKHLSALGRFEYYQYIQEYNQKYPEQRIPIICSHTGVSGYESLKDASRHPDNKQKFKGQYFNNWSINLCDEDIEKIHASEGIIGIMMDKGLLCSPEIVKKIREVKDIQKQKHAFLTIIWDNIFRIVRCIGKPGAWDTIVLGSDFDGMITHFDCYQNVSFLATIQEDLCEYLIQTGYQEAHWHGYTPKEITQKIFSKNSYRFLQKHFGHSGISETKMIG